jgi:twitching motility protein PilI
MNVSDTSRLVEWRERPFELLQEMERRSRIAAASGEATSSDAQEWVGIGCLLGNERFLVARADVREVMMMPTNITRVPGARDWVAGLANLRGQLLPLVDLRTFLGAGNSRSVRAARVLVADSIELPVGIIVDEVFGFRRFLTSEFSNEIPDTEIRAERYLAGACVRGDDVWPVLSLKALIAANEFQQAAA